MRVTLPFLLGDGRADPVTGRHDRAGWGGSASTPSSSWLHAAVVERAPGEHRLQSARRMVASPQASWIDLGRDDRLAFEIGRHRRRRPAGRPHRAASARHFVGIGRAYSVGNARGRRTFVPLRFGIEVQRLHLDQVDDALNAPGLGGEPAPMGIVNGDRRGACSRSRHVRRRCGRTPRRCGPSC